MKKYPSLSWFLYWVYQGLKGLVLSSFHCFFSVIKVVNRERLKFDHPAIIVSNHPNTLIDPLNAAARVNKVVYFLANAGLFKHPVSNYLLSRLYCIPIERPKDVAGRRIRNEDSFEKCDQFLTMGGTLYIAPQGYSRMIRRIEDIKTGTARIALSAEAKNDFNLGLKIIPVGLNYSDPQKFRSEVLIIAGEPVRVADFEAIYKENSFQAARQLTAHLQSEMERWVIDTTEEEEGPMRTMEAIIQNDQPLAMYPEFLRTKEMLSSFRSLAAEERTALSQSLINYQTKIEENKLTDRGLKMTKEKKGIGLTFILLVLGMPLFIYAWVNHIFANLIPGLLARWLPIYQGYQATVKILAGIIFYPLIFGLQIYWVHQWGGETWITLLYVLSLIVARWWLDRYQVWWELFREKTRAATFRKKHPAQFDQMLQQRSEIERYISRLSTTSDISTAIK